MKTIIHKANTRGHADYGWLKTYYSFSFANYYNPERNNFGLLRVLNDDIVEGGKGFGLHPHDNMEIVTIPLEGALEHTDSMGHKSVITKNEVQIMSAGTGVYHSEFNANQDKPVKLLQIWVYPAKQNVQPRYDQKVFDPSERINQLQFVVTPIRTNTLHLNQETYFSLETLHPGKEIQYKLQNSQNGVYMFLIDGKVSLGDVILEKRDGVGIWEIKDDLIIKALENSEILFIEVPMK